MISPDDNKPRLLSEVIRQAESRLAAQLTTALAADARAMQFLTIDGALLVLIIGAMLAAVQNAQGAPWEIFLIGGGGIVGLIFAGAHAFLAARPIPFEMVGSYPSAWADDIAANRPLVEALEEAAGLYDGMLEHNRLAMAEGSALLRRAAVWLGTTIAACGILTLALLIVRWVQTLPSA